MNCLHCDRDGLEGVGLCKDCLLIPKCIACGVIFGKLCQQNETDPQVCDGCVDFEKKIELRCVKCNIPIPLFYSKQSNVLRYIVRGNWCRDCSGECAQNARITEERAEKGDYTGYLAIMWKQMMTGKITGGAFEEAKEMNPHDIIRKDKEI